MESSLAVMSHDTQILKVQVDNLGQIKYTSDRKTFNEEWQIDWNIDTIDYKNLSQAAYELKTSDVPVAFPTETVYGLGADATRSSAVRGIFEAKQRPSDNPLIVHFASLLQLRNFLKSNGGGLIPSIYESLIKKFWPGPLTIILPNPENSGLAPEVTAGLNTFGARIPQDVLALCLIKLAGVPLAAPSANSSTKPSPTNAEHVLEDLKSRITTILDGGPCSVGVESTVVNGLANPPSILRPGGVSLQQLRECPGWENVTTGYKDVPDSSQKPMAPGMKYRHYSPRAPVILYETGSKTPPPMDFLGKLAFSTSEPRKIGLIRTQSWPSLDGYGFPFLETPRNAPSALTHEKDFDQNIRNSKSNGEIKETTRQPNSDHQSEAFGSFNIRYFEICETQQSPLLVWEVKLGPEAKMIAQGLFSSLRQLDKYDVDYIIVEGIDANESGLADAIMNRLRKASHRRIFRHD